MLIRQTIVLAVALVGLLVAPALAQTATTFTYQGSLAFSGSPLTGQADLRMRLFTAATGGSPVGTLRELPNTNITNGVFTVPLDFGSAFDAGQPRWLEVSVRSPAGSGDFTTLSPRQPITPTPLAQGLAGVPLSRGGAEALDQAQDQLVSGSYNVAYFGSCWQSWTAGVSGDLTRVQLHAVASTNSTETLTVSVHYGRGLAGPVLGVATLPVSPPGIQVPTYLRDVAIPNIPIQSGTVYTLEFSGNVSVDYNAGQIPGASGNVASNATDWWFRTYVTPPALITARATSSGFATVAGTAINATNALNANSANTATTAINATNAVNATNALNATNAVNATIASTATNATNAANAASVPWSGLTGQAAVSTGAIGSGWQILFNNSANTSFRGGMRQADSGGFEVTNFATLASPNFARLTGTGAWTAVSDGRLKSDVRTAEGNLDAAMKLRPVTFRWKADGTGDLGLIAQEVRDVLPRLVSGDEAKESLTLNYSQLSVVAIGAIQELKADNDRKQREIDELKARLAVIEAAVNAAGMGKK